MGRKKQAAVIAGAVTSILYWHDYRSFTPRVYTNKKLENHTTHHKLHKLKVIWKYTINT